MIGQRLNIVLTVTLAVAVAGAYLIGRGHNSHRIKELESTLARLDKSLANLEQEMDGGLANGK